MKTTPCPDCQTPHAIVYDDGHRVIVPCRRAPRDVLTHVADHPVGGQLWVVHPEDIMQLLTACERSSG